MPQPAQAPDPVRDLFLLTHRAIEEGITPDPTDAHILFQLAYMAHEIGLKDFPIPKKIGIQFLQFLQRNAPEIAGSRPVVVKASLQRAFDHGTLRETYEQQLQEFLLLADQEDDLVRMVSLVVKGPLLSIEGLIDSITAVSDKIAVEVNNALVEKFGQVVLKAITRGVSTWDYWRMAAVIEELGFLNAPCCNGLDSTCEYQRALLALRQEAVNTLDFEKALLIVSQFGKLYLFGPVNPDGKRIFHQTNTVSDDVILLGSGDENTWPVTAYPKKIILGQRLFIDDQLLDFRPLFSGTIVRAQQGVTVP